MLQRQLGRVAARERQHAGEHFLVNDRQRILIAVPARRAAKHFRRRVQRRQPAHQRRLRLPHVLHQAEVGDLHVAGQQQQVLRLDVEVLQRVRLAHEVERIGRVAQVAQQLVARNAAQALRGGTRRSGP